jgi:hypothetical protein
MEMKELIFEDYKMLREESLQSMRNRNEILTFGLGALGVIFHAGVNSFLAGTKDSYWLSFFIFYIGIPALSLLILTLWFGEAARMSRVGVYLMERENLINLLSGSVLKSLKVDLTSEKKYPDHFDKVVFWENYIRERIDTLPDKTRQLIFPYKAVIALFLGVSITSIIVGTLFPLRLLRLPGYVSIITLILAFLAIFIATLKLTKIGMGLK